MQSTLSKYEQHRLQAAHRVRIAYEGHWWRNVSNFGVGSSLLGGPFGFELRDQIHARYASGPNQYTATDDTGAEVAVNCYPIRWAQLEALVDPSFNPLNEARRQLSLLYRRPVVVSGEVATPVFQWLRERCDMDGVFWARQDATIGMRSCAIRPTLEEWRDGSYYPAGLATVTPDRCIAIPDPSRPKMPRVFIEFEHARGEGKATVWDVTDPNLPVWGQWRTLREWEAGDAPLWQMRGLDYPWRWRGAALMPVVCYQWEEGSPELMPVSLSELQSVYDLILDRTWISLVQFAGSFSKAVITSGMPMNGLDQTMNDPTVILNLFGDEQAKVQTVPHSMDAVAAQWEIHRQKLLEWAQRYDSGFEVRESGGAKSGQALLLELTGKYILRQHMETRARPLDSEVIRALIASHNYLVRSRQMSMRTVDGVPRATPGLPAEPTRDMLIPEGEFDVAYPHHWNAVERREIMEEMQAAVNEGRESPRALWLMERGLEDDRPDGPNWLMADEEIRRALSDRRTYASLGYGLEWDAVPTVAGVPDAG